MWLGSIWSGKATRTALATFSTESNHSINLIRNSAFNVILLENSNHGSTHWSCSGDGDRLTCSGPIVLVLSIVGNERSSESIAVRFV